MPSASSFDTIVDSPLLVVATCVFLFAISWIFKFVTDPIHKLPGPRSPMTLKGLVFGQFLDHVRLPPSDAVLSWATEFGPVVKLRMIGMHKVVISSPSALKHVLVTNVRNYPKGYRTQRVLSGILGSSLLTTHGEEHSRQRAYIAPAFHYVRMEKFHRVFAERTQKLCQVLHQNMAGSTVDITDVMAKLTLDIIGLTACGYDFNATGSDNQSAILSAYTTVFDSTGLSAVNFLFPWFEHVPTPFNLRLRAAKKMVRSKVAEVIEQKRRQEAEAAGEDDDNAQSFEATDLLGLLIKQMGADEHGNNLSTKELFSEELTAQVMTFLFAGHETTATTLCWALHLLSTHPDTQLRVQVELDEVLCGKPPTHDDMAKLPVLRATVDETLRLFSAAPITARRALRDDVIDGYKIPAGVEVLVSPGVMHRLPSLWAKPAEFIIDRWLDETLKDEGAKSPFTYMPFLVGPHGCIGRRFALLEASTALAVMLQSFSFEPVPDRSIKSTLRITQRPTPNLHLIVSPRHASK